MTVRNLEPIKELYYLWTPVYPYLAEELMELEDASRGIVAEVGPFCGALFALCRRIPTRAGVIATFPEGMGRFYQEEAEKLGLAQDVRVIETEPTFEAIRDGSIDLLLFRGAFFFPGLFSLDFRAIYRLLRRGGRALVGGGFGSRTPREVIDSIGERSRDLNLQAGKTQVTMEYLAANLKKCGLSDSARIITSGGLWVQVEKP